LPISRLFSFFNHQEFFIPLNLPCLFFKNMIIWPIAPKYIILSLEGGSFFSKLADFSKEKKMSGIKLIAGKGWMIKTANLIEPWGVDKTEFNTLEIHPSFKYSTLMLALGLFWIWIWISFLQKLDVWILDCWL